jgi:hypothetical protein
LSREQTLSYIVAICLCGTFCLAPLTMYLMWLARITRRDHPTTVSGQWDFAGVLVGLSGFIVVGGGLVLTLFQSNFRYWMRGNAEAFRNAWIEERSTWTLLVVLYLVFVFACAGLALLARRRSLVVYNVEPAAFETVLSEVFDQLGRPAERRGKLWSGASPLCEVDTFEGGRTVTLRWVSEDVRLFEEVTRQLRAALATQITEENAVHRWLNATSIGTGLLALASCGLLIFYVSLLR